MQRAIPRSPTGSNETESDDNSTDTTESDGNSTDTTDNDGNSTEDGTSSVDRAAMVLMSNVLNTRVYDDDVEN